MWLTYIYHSQKLGPDFIRTKGNQVYLTFVIFPLRKALCIKKFMKII